MRIEPNDIVDLRPVIHEVVAQVLDKLQAQRDQFDVRLAYSEVEAASLLGVKSTVLRDCRLRGEIQARKVGKEYRYERTELLRFLRESQ